MKKGKDYQNIGDIMNTQLFLEHCTNCDKIVNLVEFTNNLGICDSCKRDCEKEREYEEENIAG